MDLPLFDLLRKTMTSAESTFMAKATEQSLNWLLARRPEFVIIGTGRCGTGYTSEYLTRIGLPCAHEGYFTLQGPTLRNRHRARHSRGDASWLAVPFLNERGRIPVFHQVRHPLKVVESFYKRQFFDRAKCRRPEFLTFAAWHFTLSDDPLDSSIRWYVEWNKRCEHITDNRYQVEEFNKALPAIVGSVGHPMPDALPSVGTDINTREALLDLGDFRTKLERSKFYPQLVETANRYGYSL